jgi:hypothetical protein
MMHALMSHGKREIAVRQDERAVRTDRNVKRKAGDFVSPIEHLQIEMWLHKAEENFQRRPETLSTLGSNSRGEAALPRRNAVNLSRWM